MHRAIHPARKSRRPRRRHRRRGDRRGPARHVDRTRIRLRRPENVKPGDAVTYRLNDRDFNTDHVGIVTKVDKKTGKITVISGNSGDKIRKVTIDPKKAQVTGYASPVEKKNSKPKKSADPDNKKSDKKKKKNEVKKPQTKKVQPKKAEDTRPGQVEPEGPLVLDGSQVATSHGLIG